MTRRRTNPLNPGEAKDLTTKIDNLSEIAARSALFGIVTALSYHAHLAIDYFSDIINDATKYDTMLKKEKG
jgi:hypothetical protein